jgi:hypothetical protein
MSLETALRSYVLADVAIAAAVGVRMYPRRLPQGPTLPALVYQRVDTRRLHDFDGPDGLPRARVQIAAWASNVAGAWELANAVRARLDGYRGAWGDVTIGSCLCVGERDIDDPETGRAGVAQDYHIQFVEE